MDVVICLGVGFVDIVLSCIVVVFREGDGRVFVIVLDVVMLVVVVD